MKTLLPPTALFTLFLLLCLTATSNISAQQLDVDDSQLSENRSMQLEAWYDNQSWILGTINPLNFMEFSSGIGFNSSNRFSTERWAIESKISLLEPEKSNLGVALVGGFYSDFSPSLREFIGYIPITKLLPDDRSMIHLNMGYEAIFEDLIGSRSNLTQSFFSGLRGDIYLFNNFTFLGEIVLMNFEDPLFQAGLKWSFLPERAEFVVSYGEYFHARSSEPGINFGLTIMTDSLW